MNITLLISAVLVIANTGLCIMLYRERALRLDAEDELRNRQIWDGQDRRQRFEERAIVPVTELVSRHPMPSLDQARQVMKARREGKILLPTLEISPTPSANYSKLRKTKLVDKG